MRSFARLAAIGISLAVTGLLSNDAEADPCSREWSTAFDGGDFDGTVTAIVEWNGYLYAGGDFSRAGGEPASGLARWDGSSWAEVGGGLRSWVPFNRVQELVVFDDGSGEALFLCGTVVEAGGVPVSGVARWDGSSWDAVGGGVTDGSLPSVNALAIHDDGSGPALYAGGVFLEMGGVSVLDVARWDGSSWSSVGTGLDPVSQGVYAMTTWSGRLVVGGDFQAAGPVGASRLAAWDGSSWSEVGGGVTFTVYDLGSYDLGSGEELFAGGSLYTAGGLPVSGVAAWDGVAWNDLDGGVEGFDGLINFAFHDDGSGPAVFVGGRIAAAGGVPADYLAKWDGSQWSDASITLNSTVNEMRVIDGDLYLGGNFTTADGQVSMKLCRWDGAAAHPIGNTNIGNGLSGNSLAAAVVDHDGAGGEDPRQYVAGAFLNAGDTFVGLVAELDGNVWLPLAEEGPNTSALLALAHDDGSGEALYVSGGFTTVGDLTVNHIARFDGSSWSDLAGGLTNTGILPSPLALAHYDDGTGSRLYVAGYRFDSAGGVPVRNIAAWDGSTWSDPGGGIPETLIMTLAAHDDGSGSRLYAGGIFEAAGGVPAANVAAWDGTNWSPVGPGLNGSVRKLISFDPGGGPLLFAAGDFTASGATPLGPVAIWDGAAWSDASAGFQGTNPVFGIFDDGTGPALHVATRRSSTESRLSRWDGDSWVDLPAVFDGSVSFVQGGVDPAGAGAEALLVGGSFLNVDGVSSARFARFGCQDVSGWGPVDDEWRPSWFRAAQPNPSRDDVSFHLDLARPMPVRLDIFDAMGARLRSEFVASSGSQVVLRWDGRDGSGVRLPAGAYFYRIEAGDERHAGRLTVIR